MTAFLALVRKDIRLYLANRRALLMSLVAPIAIGAFMGSLFDGRESGPQAIAVAFTDDDGSTVATQLAAALAGEKALALKTLPEVEARAAVRAGRVRAWVRLPAGFGAQAVRALVGGGPRPAIALAVDPSQAMVEPMVRGLLAQHAMQAVGRAAFGGGPATAGNAPDGAAVALGAGPAHLPFDLAPSGDAVPQLAGAGYSGYAHSFAGMAVQFILLFGVDVGIVLLTLRRQGLWLRLRAAPLSRAQLLGSRWASAALIGFGIFAVVMAVAVAGFGVKVLGSVAGMLAVMAAYAVFAAAFGLLIAAIGRTPEATRGLAILATLLMVMLGGAWVPSFIFPPWLQAVSAWTPTHWAVSGLDAMTWRGLGASAALAPVAVLLGAAAVAGALALARFPWHE